MSVTVNVHVNKETEFAVKVYTASSGEAIFDIALGYEASILTRKKEAVLSLRRVLNEFCAQWDGEHAAAGEVAEHA